MILFVLRFATGQLILVTFYNALDHEDKKRLKIMKQKIQLVLITSSLLIFLICYVETRPHLSSINIIAYIRLKGSNCIIHRNNFHAIVILSGYCKMTF